MEHTSFPTVMADPVVAPAAEVVSDVFTETIVSWIFYLFELMGTKKHARVLPGKLSMIKPFTFYGQFERYMKILGYAEDIQILGR